MTRNITIGQHNKDSYCCYFWIRPRQLSGKKWR